MNKPGFIDFGCGPNMSYSIKYKSKGYYVVIIERSEEYLYENSDMSRADIEWFKMIADEIFSDKTRDELIDEIKICVDIPILSEKTEKAIMEALWKLIKVVLMKKMGI